MVLIEDILVDLGFKEVEPFMEERVFKFSTDKVIIEVVHLSMIPKFLLGSGYSIKVTHRSGRKIQLERNYIPEGGESFEQTLAMLVFGIGLRLDEISENEITWYKLGME